MIHRLVTALPPGFVRCIGRLQFRFGLMRWCVLRLNARLTEREGTIKHGVGAGLRFNGAGGQPGYLLGTSEEREQELLRTYLRPGDVFYDIGANVGFFSTLAARLVAPGGQVWAFEPYPESARRARHNARLNGFEHVTVVEAAVGRRAGHAPLELGPGSTQHRLNLAGDGPLVQVISIDEWHVGSGASAPTLVMIDVEGGEVDVLAGMVGVLAEHRPVIACEVHGRGEQFRAFVADRLVPLGYSLSPLNGGALPASERWHALLLAENGSM